PIVDNGGRVLGMLKSANDGNRQFPDEVSFATKADALESFLESNGVRIMPAQGTGSLTPRALSETTADMSVLVSCYE
ncbi:MAG: peptidoglycan-binding protein, partial [Maritimibacter harenae]